jgi:hypothetical protein
MLRHFHNVGYVIARSDWAILAEDASMLFAQGGFFKSAHRHADDFSFEWFEHGRKILSDSGKYAYTPKRWENYFESTRAHNTVEVDGRNHSDLQQNAYGDAVRSAEMTDGGIRIVMQVFHQHPRIRARHQRQIDYRPGEELSIKDTLSSARSRVYVQWHHFAREFELSGDAGSFEIDDGEMLVGLATSTSCGDETRYMKIRGQKEPRLQGWASVDDRERHPRWALGVECEARNATFEARYQLEPVAPVLAVSLR